MAQRREKDLWDKLAVCAAVFASILVPVVLAVVGQAYTSAMKESENRVKYTELAISVLKNKPRPDNQDIRAWAIDIVDRFSGVPLSPELRKSLLSKSLTERDLQRSDFSESNLSNSRFELALLDGSSFRRASLRGVDLSGADLTGAIVDGEIKLPK
jgi:hypothetical protein